jgi:hypothetical protein
MMDNVQVIASLNQLIEALRARLRELEGMLNDPTVPLSERLNRESRILGRMDAINNRIMHANIQLHNRQLAGQLGAAVPPLGPTEVAALTTALQRVSSNIAAAATFSDSIALASQIADAATNGVDAASI